MDLKCLPLMLLVCFVGSFVHCQNDNYDDKEDSEEIRSGTGSGTGSVKTVPPAIIDELSSDDFTVQEGDTVVLICNVTGVPRPEVTWYRRPALGKTSEREKIEQSGEMIIIRNVSRYCDDIYECIASNGVPPAVSRQMRVYVEFPPEITLPNRRLGQQRNRETILECTITAYPQAVAYWEKDGKRISSTTKHRIDAYDESDNTLILSLKINGLELHDYGEYKCVAANALGKDEKSMYLYEYTDSEERTKFPHETLVVTYNPTHSTYKPIFLNTPAIKRKVPVLVKQTNSGHLSIVSRLVIGSVILLSAATFV